MHTHTHTQSHTHAHTHLHTQVLLEINYDLPNNRELYIYEVMSHKSESCRTWITRVAHECAMSHIKEPYRACFACLEPSTAQKTRESCIYWVIPHRNEACRTWMSHVTLDWVMAYMNESCRTGVAGDHVRSAQHPRVLHSLSRFTDEWVISHMNQPCHTWRSRATHGWVMAYMNESCRTGVAGNQLWSAQQPWALHPPHRSFRSLRPQRSVTNSMSLSRTQWIHHKIEWVCRELSATSPHHELPRTWCVV